MGQGLWSDWSKSNGLELIDEANLIVLVPKRSGLLWLALSKNTEKEVSDGFVVRSTWWWIGCFLLATSTRITLLHVYPSTEENCWKKANDHVVTYIEIIMIYRYNVIEYILNKYLKNLIR